MRDFGENERLVYIVTDYIDGTEPADRDGRAEARCRGRARWNLFGQMLDATTVLNARGGYIVGVNPDMIRLGRQGDRERSSCLRLASRSVQDVLATMREQELRGEEANEQELPYMAPEVLMGRALEPRPTCSRSACSCIR